MNPAGDETRPFSLRSASFQRWRHRILACQSATVHVMPQHFLAAVSEEAPGGLFPRLYSHPRCASAAQLLTATVVRQSCQRSQATPIGGVTATSPRAGERAIAWQSQDAGGRVRTQPWIVRPASLVLAERDDASDLVDLVAMDAAEITAAKSCFVGRRHGTPEPRTRKTTDRLGCGQQSGDFIGRPGVGLRFRCRLASDLAGRLG